MLIVLSSSMSQMGFFLVASSGKRGVKKGVLRLRQRRDEREEGEGG